MALAMAENQPDWVDIGRRVHIQRNQKGLNKKDAARQAHISDSTWHKIERGRGVTVRTDILVRVATTLDFDPEEFLARAGRNYEPLDLPDIPPLPTATAAFADVLKSFPQLQRNDRQLLVELFNRLVGD